MAEKWEEQLKEFWKRAGQDLKRTTDELRQEAQKLITQVQDPANQEKLKHGLREFGDWTRKTVEVAALKFEKAIDRAGDRVGEWTTQPREGGAAAPATPAAGEGRTKEEKTARPRAKTVAKAKASGGSKKKAKGKTPTTPTGKRK